MEMKIKMKKIILLAIPVILMISMVMAPNQGEAKVYSDAYSGEKSIYNTNTGRYVTVGVVLDQTSITEDTTEITGHLVASPSPSGSGTEHDLVGLYLELETNASFSNHIAGTTIKDSSGYFKLKFKKQLATQTLNFKIGSKTIVHVEVEPISPNIILSNTDHQIKIETPLTTKSSKIKFRTFDNDGIGFEARLYVNGKVVDSTSMYREMSPILGYEPQMYFTGMIERTLTSKELLHVGDIYKIEADMRYGTIFAVGVVEE